MAARVEVGHRAHRVDTTLLSCVWRRNCPRQGGSILPAALEQGEAPESSVPIPRQSSRHALSRNSIHGDPRR